jgi:methyl-accepting chemotaxis protein
MSKFLSRSLFWKLFIPVAVVLAVCGVVATLVLASMIRGSSEQDAIADAQQTVNQFKALRKYYTENVVAKIVAKGDLKVSFDHRDNADTVPLPATMIHDLSGLFKEEGTSLKLYSPLPFPNRKDRVLDKFGEEAWAFLKNNPDKAFHRVESSEGKTVVRVALADKLVAPACVNCHNTLATSPKKDWKLGDVRGVLEVSSDSQIASGERISGRILWALAIMMVVLAASLRVIYQRVVARPLRVAVDAADRVATGDLSVRLEVRSEDELGQLAGALNRTVGQLNEIVSRIKSSSDTVGTAAQEIAQSHADLSSRTEQQASSLEETAASMEQMTATVAQNAENAKKANELAKQASGVAQEGGQAVREVVGTMDGITASSKKIGDIIGVIDGIAFQTNILALNAAVEAARAGEQGRGFAVVASEVRNLAQRSAAAAKEIKGLIGDSVVKVEAGSRQVEMAGRTVEEIVASVKKVSALVAEITSASAEQSQSIAQVSDTVQQLEKVTQQNAAMVEQATAASANLDEQAQAMTKAVGSFKLVEAGRAVPPVATPLPMLRARPDLNASLEFKGE